MKETVEKKVTLSEEERKKIYNKKYYAEHKESERQRVEAYRREHREEIQKKNKEYRERNADRIKAYRDTPQMKQYQKAYQKAYRAKKKAEAGLMKQDVQEQKIDEKKIMITDALSIWIGIKSLIDIQAQSQDISQQNFEDFLFENGELGILNEICNSYFLWQRACNYFSSKQREIIRDKFCEEIVNCRENDERNGKYDE